MNISDRSREPTINDEEPVVAPEDEAQQTQELEAAGIVSVNQHGKKASNTAGKIGFIVICGAILLAGGLTAWNKHRVSSSVDAEAAKVAAKAENKPAAVGKPRSFPEVAPQPAVTEVKTVSGGVVKVDAQGYVVPDTVAGPLDSNAKPVAAGGQGGTGAGGQPTPDRYSGDIMVSSGGLGGAGSTGGGGAVGPSAAQSAAEAYANTVAKILDRSGAMGGGPAVNSAEDEEGQSSGSAMASQLAGSAVPTVTATRLADRSMVLPKGKSIDCTLTSRIISELPGYVTCVLQNNVYSDDQRVLLLEKGSEATGEFGNTVVQGQHRLFVLWDRIKTPNGVLISLNSPGTDSLGTSGVPGYVDNRWFERIGSAFLLSFIKDAIAFKLTENSGGGAGGNYAFQDSIETGNKMAEKVLESTINLKPVLYANQGDTLAIFVARDLDFSTVYKLSLR